MSDYIHTRINNEEREILKQLYKETGENTSVLIKRGLRLVYDKEIKHQKTAFHLARKSVGKFSSPISDLSINKKHLKGYGR